MTRTTRKGETQGATRVEPQSYPLTPMQMGMIYESNLSDRPWINLEQLVCRLSDEPVDLAAMAAAWQALAARHDILRSRFDWQGQQVPTQFVQPCVEVALDLVDLREIDAAAQEARLQQWLDADRTHGVDLAQAPNWRVTWFQTGESSSVLVWTFHHAALDGRSFTALLAEVLDGYSERVAGAAPVAAAPVQTRFAAHCQALAAADHSDGAAHFGKALAGFDNTNRVDLGEGLDGEAEPRKKLVEQRLPMDLGRALAAKAQRSNTTVATLVMAAWGLVVARCSGRGDAVIGVTRAGRHLIDGAAEIAGCLINTLPQRISTAPERTLDDLLAAIRADQLALRPFEQTPLTEIARATDLPGGAALFESALIFERGSVGNFLRARGGIWEKRQIEVLEEGALPLTLAVYQDAEMLLRLEYDPQRYSAEVAGRLLGYTCNLLKIFTEIAGDTPLARVDMLPKDEARHVLRLGCSSERGALPPVVSIATAFAEQVKARPDAIALRQVGQSDTLSFAELDARADLIAAQLTAQGAGAGTLVAICLPRSMDFVAAALASQKLGAAFLPIDPKYPAAAIAHMLEDSRASHLVSDRVSLPECDGISVVLVDAIDRAPGDVALPAPKVDGDATAYVIYTSGTTGAPKGVMISQSAICTHIGSITDAFGLGAQDRVLQFASLSFDVSIEEILPTVLAGAQLILRSDAMAESMAGFLEEVAAAEMTVLNLPTAFWHALVDHIETTGATLLDSVRLVIVGGEAISPVALAKWQKLVPGPRWLNGYGPTEATITATLYDPTMTGAPEPGEDVPIGQPLRHTRAYILSPDGAMAPMGAGGELWLGGGAIAQGYLERPEMTAARFLPDPFAPDPQAQMYRSGDIVRWRGDGTLAFGGRSDRQVKVNGFRIELREIEKVLEFLPDVGLALCAVDHIGTPKARLLGWFTPAVAGGPVDVDAVRAQVQARLPKHMVPTLVGVAEFPKTPGGKVDIKALPRPVQVAQSSGDMGAASAEVQRICGIIAGVLGLDRVSPDASFFDLGGHSLLAVGLIGRIETEFGQRLSISQLHGGPSAREIAGALQAQGDPGGHDLIVPIQPRGDATPIFGVHVLGSNECFFRPLAESLGPDQPLFGLTVGPLTAASPTGVEETAAAYFEAVQAFCPDGPVCLAAVSQGSYIAFDLARQLRAAGREVAMLALFDAAGPGGRARVQGRARIGRHAQQLLRRGPAYLKVLAGNRIEGLRNTFEKAKIRIARRFGLPEMGNPSVEQFVAANTLAIESYRAQPYAGRLTIFRAQGSVFDAPEAIRSGLGWGGVAGGGFDLIEVPGEHLSMLAPPHVDTLAAHLRERLAGSAG